MQRVFKLKSIKHSRKSQNTCAANQIQALSKLQIVLIYFHLFWISPLVMGKERYSQFYQTRTTLHDYPFIFSSLNQISSIPLTCTSAQRTNLKEDLTLCMLNIISKVIKELSKFLASHNHDINGVIESVSLRTWLCQSVQLCV